MPALIQSTWIISGLICAMAYSLSKFQQSIVAIIQCHKRAMGKNNGVHPECHLGRQCARFWKKSIPLRQCEPKCLLNYWKHQCFWNSMNDYQIGALLLNIVWLCDLPVWVKILLQNQPLGYCHLEISNRQKCPCITNYSCHVPGLHCLGLSWG